MPEPSTRYTHTGNGRTWRLYGCAKRGCDTISLDYESFGTQGGKSYCLCHIPLRSKLRLWWQERGPDA